LLRSAPPPRRPQAINPLWLYTDSGMALRNRLWLFIALMVSPGAMTLTLDGNNTVTAAEQKAIDAHVSYFGRASVFYKEYCYFDDLGRAKNRGKCHVDLPRSPHGAAGRPGLGGGSDSEYERQYRGTPIGKAVADPEIELIYLHTMPDIWMACNNRKAFGCTYNEHWPDRVTIFVPTLDKSMGNLILNHEIEYHAKRNIVH
jgi:hypothetical protein